MDGAPAAKQARKSGLRTRHLGPSPLVVSEVGYGTWPLSYDNRPSEEDAIAILHRALDLGIRFLDTADAYCLNEGEKHHSERLIRKALSVYPDQRVAEQVVVATKGVCVRPEGRWERCPTAERIKEAIAGSHEALSGKERPIDLWQVHWCNPMNPPNPADDTHLPLETLLAPAGEAVRSGVVRFVGLSNCTVEQVKLAQEVLPQGSLVSVQNRYNLWDRSSERQGVLEYCQEQGLAFLPWSPLGGADMIGETKDESKFPKLNRLAKEKGCSPEALVLAYMRAKWSCITHITAARRLSNLQDTLSSADLAVTAEDIATIDSEGDQGEGQPAYLAPPARL